MSGIALANVPQKKPFSVPTLDINQCLNTDPPAYDFVLPGLLAGTVGGLVAPGGVGKSTYALGTAVQIACAAAGGPDLLNLGQIKAGKVVILAGEDPHITLWHRLHAIKPFFTQEQQELLDKNLIIKECVGQGMDLMNSEHAEYIKEISTGARLVIIDTLTRFHMLDENKADDAKRIMAMLEANAHQTKSANLFVHYVTKFAASSGSGDLQQAARGSSVFVDNARWLAFLAGMTTKEAEDAGILEEDRRKYVRWNISKQNYDGPRGDQWFIRQDGGILVAGELQFESARITKATKTRMKRTSLGDK